MIDLFISEALGLNGQGHLTIGGCDTLKLAEQYGTPLYVMDEDLIRENCRRFTRSIEKCFDGRGSAAFASKAFCCKEMCRLADSEGMHVDVCSAGELYTALEAGVDASNLIFHGNNKTPEELAYAIREKVGRIVVDNIFELEMLDEIAKSAKTRAEILLRIKPGVEAHTHEFIKTGGIDSKFGFALETGEAMAAILETKRMEYVDLVGLHCHIGSQIFGIEPFGLAAEKMFGLMIEAKAELGFELKELNLGGGYGIKYLPEHDPVPYESYMEVVASTIKKMAAKAGHSMPFVLFEPGRSIVGSAGITLYRVGAVKEIPGVRTYVSVDGGMTDNPRPGLYGAEYTMVIANKAKLPRDKVYTVSGRCCETDMLGENVALQETRVGDLMAVLATGAYNYSMASNYNRLPKPAVVFASKGEARVVVRRQSHEDITCNDI